MATWTELVLPIIFSFEEYLVFCLFYLAKSRAESTAQLGRETWSERLQKKPEHSLVFCLFYLAKCRSESTAQIGRESWVFDCHFWIRQSTSDFSLFWGVFGVLPFLFGLFPQGHWSLINLLSDPYWCQRPYHAEYTSSRPITEVKQRQTQLSLGWIPLPVVDLPRK